MALRAHCDHLRLMLRDIWKVYDWFYFTNLRARFPHLLVKLSRTSHPGFAASSCKKLPPVTDTWWPCARLVPTRSISFVDIVMKHHFGHILRVLNGDCGGTGELGRVNWFKLYLCRRLATGRRWNEMMTLWASVRDEQRQVLSLLFRRRLILR